MPASSRLAELLGSLSLATDLAAALPRETALRTSLVAVRLARLAGVQGFELADVYYVGLLRFLGCSAYAYEMAQRYAAGDDLSLLRELTLADPRKPLSVLQGAMRGISKRAPLRERARAFGRLASSPESANELFTSHCELAVLLARRLGMSEGVIAALHQAYERWDGKGAPAGLRGDAIRLPARILHVAWRYAAHFALEGEAAALDMLRARSRHEFDPSLVALALREHEALRAGLAQPSAWEPFLAAEPAPNLQLEPRRRLDVARVFASFADVKSPWIAGHSRAVAELVERAAPKLGLEGDALDDARVAALLHDVGRVAVANGVWDKPGPLDGMERELMQAHAAETERVLARSSLLAPLAKLAAMAHERLDAGGYPRGSGARALPVAARVLAAADVCSALGEARPHRPALAPAEIARTLEAEVQAGRLCRDAVAAVLDVAGHPRPPASAEGSLLSEREQDVLRLVARGHGNKQIAARLHISPATVKRHLENTFDKIGVRTRAAATVWALEHGCLHARE
jgi:HD-GYP domain-containing protein (c-di-GMP phosphodiesterase class II)